MCAESSTYTFVYAISAIWDTCVFHSAVHIQGGEGSREATTEARNPKGVRDRSIGGGG